MSTFLELVYNARDPGDQVDLIVDGMDDLLIDGDMEGVDLAFRTCEAERLCVAGIVSMLGITLAARGKLSERPKFFERARAVVAARRGSDEAAMKLLGKYQ